MSRVAHLDLLLPFSLKSDAVNVADADDRNDGGRREEAVEGVKVNVKVTGQLKLFKLLTPSQFRYSTVVTSDSCGNEEGV
jgi:hypothetical protein